MYFLTLDAFPHPFLNHVSTSANGTPYNKALCYLMCYQHYDLSIYTIITRMQ